MRSSSGQPKVHLVFRDEELTKLVSPHFLLILSASFFDCRFQIVLKELA